MPTDNPSHSMHAADFSRNIGLLTAEQQAALNSTKATICGVGGMGAVVAEALVRMGVGNMTILDHDRFEKTDTNRHIYCNTETIGQQKVDVTASRLQQINPNLNISTFSQLSIENASDVVAGADVVINGMDQVLASIILEREARRQQKPIVDAWLTPYASVFVMRSDAPHWEEFLGFPSLGKPIEEITMSDIEVCLRREIEFTLKQFQTYEIISPQLVENVITNRVPRPSLVPVVWMSGILMANEVMKLVTCQGRLATHWGVFYNQYDHEIRYYDSHGR